MIGYLSTRMSQCAIVALTLFGPVQVVVAQSTPEVEATLYQVADTLGMLRTSREVDRVATIIYSATGTMVANGQTCTIENYTASVRYPIPGSPHAFPLPGMRVDFNCASDNGEPERQVHVVAGELAWNETEPGVNATPAVETVRERLLQAWLIPQGLVKAATAAGAQTVAATESGNPTLTFPLPAPLEDIVVKITLDPEIFLYHTMPTGVRREFSHRISRVETELDGAAIEVSYSNYQDWNEADYKSDVLLPGRITQMVDGATTLDLTLIQSNTYNPYVVVPVPENIVWEGARTPDP